MSSPSQIFYRSSLYIALLAAWIAMLGSLYFSEVLGYIPCNLCWYQRILMYPLTVILAVGLLRQDSNVSYYALPLSVIGQGVATYHYLLQKTTIFAAPTACSTGVPCSSAWINWFGFITIPFLAMTAFFIITIMSLVAITAGEPDESENRPTPWLAVGSAIGAVIVGFGILYLINTQPEPTLALTEVAHGEQTMVATPIPTLVQGSDLAEGQQIYRYSCAACHGQDAHGLPNLGNSLVESAIIHESSDAEAVAFIRAGVDLDDASNTTGLVMPPSGGRPDLSDAQILSVINYIRGQ